jgi:hypothetical protein
MPVPRKGNIIVSFSMKFCSIYLTFFLIGLWSSLSSLGYAIITHYNYVIVFSCYV